MLAHLACCPATPRPEWPQPDVEVFKTNVATAAQAAAVLRVVHAYFPRLRATFDLEDRDKVLRVQARAVGALVPGRQILRLVCALGVVAEVLAE